MDAHREETWQGLWKNENSVLANASCLGRGIGIRGSRGRCVVNANVNFNGIVILPLLFIIRNRKEGCRWRHGRGAGGRWRVQSGGATWDGAIYSALR